MADAPKITEHLCDDCREHYDTVKAYLGGAGLSFEEDPKLVRGLDYYTRTVFEVQVTEGMGSQNAIGGGGRYDKLAEEVGGRPTPGFGFALGYERCALALQAAGYEFPAARRCDFFVACVDELAAGQVKVRNMRTHQESAADLAALKKLLAHFGGEPFGGEADSLEAMLGKLEAR